MAAERGDTLRRWAAQGMAPLAPEQGLDVLELLMAQTAPQIGILPVDWPQFIEHFPAGSAAPFLSGLAVKIPSRDQSQQLAAERQAFLRRLEQASPAKRQELLATLIREQVIAVLNLPPAHSLDLQQGLFELGMDSLMALEVKNRLQNRLGLELPATIVFEHGTVVALAAYLAGKLYLPEPPTLQLPDPQEDPELDALVAEIEGLSEADLDRELAELADDRFQEG